MRRIGKLLLLIIKSFVILVTVGFILSSSTKNIQTLVLVNNFKSKGVYQEDISTSKEKYYLIETGDYLGYTTIRGVKCPGAPGDILVTKEAEIGGPLARGFVSFFVGGHAAYCLDNYYDKTLDTKLLPAYDRSLEATGLEPDTNLSTIDSREYWATDDVYHEVIGLRVNATEEQRNEILSIMCSYTGDPYNFSFLFDTKNKSYCSDIISKGYAQAGFNLNKDGFITSIYDLIVTNETYISYYHCYIDGVKYIYYVG